VQARGIHGDKVQYQRDSIFGAFKKPIDNETSILIATDVASRGLDVRDIGVVINFDMPTNIEDYVHRIGRTGRAGDKGRAISFLNSSELGIVNDLVKIMKSSNQRIPDQLYDLKQ
jgi:ATP-dependent RNA helicase DDX5/DBP2